MRFGENIDDVINNLENHSNRPTNGAQRLSVFFRGPSMVGAEVACRSNQHGGLFLNDLHVVVNRIRFTRTDSFAHLPGHKFFESLGKMLNGRSEEHTSELQSRG